MKNILVVALLFVFLGSSSSAFACSAWDLKCWKDKWRAPTQADTGKVVIEKGAPGKAIEKGAQDTGKVVIEKGAPGKAIEKGAQDTGKVVIERGGLDTGKAIEKDAQDTGKQSKRTLL
jgi:hypothetical protein